MRKNRFFTLAAFLLLLLSGCGSYITVSNTSSSSIADVTIGDAVFYGTISSGNMSQEEFCPAGAYYPEFTISANNVWIRVKTVNPYKVSSGIKIFMPRDVFTIDDYICIHATDQ